MKTEMAMLPNGNYERIISPIQHQCRSKDYIFECIEYGWDIGQLQIKIEDGNPYEDGYSNSIEVNYCPFCGYQPERSKREDTKCDYCIEFKKTKKGPCFCACPSKL